jgi:putative amidase-like protein
VGLSALFATLLLVAVALPSLADSDNPQGPTFDDPHSQRELADSRERENKRKERRQTAAAKEERRRSRTAYRDQSRREALARAEDSSPSAVHAPSWKPLRLREGERVTQYRGELSALVEKSNGKKALVQSFLPLRSTAGSGDEAAVSLELEEHANAYAPKNPLVTTEIPKRLRDGLAFPRAGFSLRPDAAAQPEDPIAVDDKVFYANVATDSDLLVAPAPTGAELSLQLRSEDSPEETTLLFDLPAGATLRSADDGSGNVAIVRGDERIALVTAPLAVDADGEAVAASYSISGDRLTIRVPHRSGDVHYPILVDPIIDNYRLDGAGNRTYVDDLVFAGWDFFKNDKGNTACTIYNSRNGSSYGNGLYVYTTSATPCWYLDGQYGEWTWTAPRQSYIERGDFGYVDHDPVSTCVVEGIYAPSRAAYDSGHWDQVGSNPTGPSPWYVSNGASNNTNPCYDLNANYKAHHPDVGTNPVRPTPGNMMVYGLLINVTGNRWSRALTHMYGASIWLNDYESPTITSAAPSSAWRDDGGSITTTVSATDAGLGMRAFNLFLPSGAVAKWVTTSGALSNNSSSACTGDRNSRCPQSASGSYTYTLPEGVNSPTLAGYDALSKSTGQTWTLKIDRSAPSLELSGTLADNSDMAIGPGTYGLHVDATDGDAASNATARSGVKKVTVAVDGVQKLDSGPQTCQAGSCSLSVDWTFDSTAYSEGQHTIAVTAEDQLGHTATKTITVTVVRLAPRNTVPPSVSGETQDGQTLTANPGSWVSAGPIAFTYQWQGCDALGGNCADLDGADSQSYKLTSGDVGTTLRVVVTASNAAGAASAPSPSTAIVRPGVPNTVCGDSTPASCAESPEDSGSDLYSGPLVSAIELLEETIEPAVTGPLADATGDVTDGPTAESVYRTINDTHLTVSSMLAPARDDDGNVLGAATAADVVGTAAGSGMSKNFWKDSAAWGRAHWNRTSSAVENLPEPYGNRFPATDADDGRDCVNFAGHSWKLGGGLKISTKGGYNGGWYVKSNFSGPHEKGQFKTRVYSKAWLVVRNFYKFFINHGAVAYSVKPWHGDVAQSRGDVVQYDFGRGQGYSHTALIDRLNGDGAKDTITQWSKDRPPTTHWNHFREIESNPRVKARERARIIHMQWYYK